MGSVFTRSADWVSFSIKVLTYTAVVNLCVLPILWVSNTYSALIFVYEAAVLLFLGGVELLLSYVYYEKDTSSAIDQKYPYPGPSILNHKQVFKRLKPDERKRYRQEGMIMVVFGLSLVLVAIIAQLAAVIY